MSVYSFFAVLYSYMQPIIGMGVPVVVSCDYILLILIGTVGVCGKLMVTLFSLCKKHAFYVVNTEDEKHTVMCQYVQVMCV
jgi:hypothetical protein